MAYRLRADETVHAGVCRIVHEEIDAAIAELEAGPVERDARVHRGRRHVKRARAVLKLWGTPALLDEGDRRLRDAARLVSTTRDAAVAVAAFDSLRARFPREAGRPAFQLVRTGLLLRHRSILLSPVTSERIERFGSELSYLRSTTLRLPADDEIREILPGLGSTYRAGRRAMAAAYRRPSPDRFHDWRRHVRYHALHAALLREVSGPAAGKRMQRAGRLAERLGMEHDLSVLGALLIDQPARFGGPAAVHPLLSLLGRRRVELRSQAKPLGRKLFRDRPARLVDRFRDPWEARFADVDARRSGSRPFAA